MSQGSTKPRLYVLCCDSLSPSRLIRRCPEWPSNAVRIPRSVSTEEINGARRQNPGTTAVSLLPGDSRLGSPFGLHVSRALKNCLLSPIPNSGDNAPRPLLLWKDVLATLTMTIVSISVGMPFLDFFITLCMSFQPA